MSSTCGGSAGRSTVTVPAKLIEMRCEPGVGGRLLEIYDRGSGEGLELARITAWEPGRHLAWKSSLDDVTIDVRFDATHTGTKVRLEAIIPEGGSDRGGTSFIRVTPRWLGAWIAKRETTPHELHDLARFALTLYYAQPATTARWLATAFGFESPNALPEPEDDEEQWIELHAGNCSLMIDRLVGPPVDHGQLTHMPWVFVDDLAAHLTRAQSNGATIVEGITTHGFASYVALDIEGRSWRIAEARPTQPR